MKKGWLGTKIEINPTEEGYREFERQLKILQEKWNQLENTPSLVTNKNWNKS